MVKYLVVDVDGTLTDGGVYYDENGNELKKFSTKDAAGFFALKEAGVHAVIITGRTCKATERRMKEMKVEFIFQGIKDKKGFLVDFLKANKIEKQDLGYIGDDLNDLPSMKMAGYVACPADACTEVKSIANYVSPVNGGYGAARDCIEHMLHETGEWGNIIKKIYGGT